MSSRQKNEATHELEQQLKTFFRISTWQALASEEDWTNDIHPDEERAIANAVPARRREFTAGRSVARKLLRSAGVECSVIRVNQDRTPQWPPSWVGSISHSNHQCWVAISEARHCSGIGIDVEKLAALDHAVSELVLTESEKNLARLQHQPELACVIFSCKESLHKAIYPATGIRLDFQDVAIDLMPGTRFIASINHHGMAYSQLTGHYLTHQGYVYSAVELP